MQLELEAETDRADNAVKETDETVRETDNQSHRQWERRHTIKEMDSQRDRQSKRRTVKETVVKTDSSQDGQ